jgi:NAD(P)-dependent dehydrogenase (short-subunit alcohol dehydrogenase family)
MQRPIALITGARRGIGKAIALEFADSGFDVALTDIQPSDELDDVCRLVARRGARAISVVSDLAAIDMHDALLSSVEAQLGPITCLVNNAGVSVISRGDLLDVSQESYDRCLNVNTRGTFFLMQAFGRRVRARQTHAGTSSPELAPRQTIVTISSSNAVAASTSRGEYCVSKAALSMATTLFSLRLAELGMAVYEVQPGLIETEMTAPSRHRYDALVENGQLAIGRWGRPEDVALTVRTLATGGLPYSAGQAIRVDGGLLVRKF